MRDVVVLLSWTSLMKISTTRHVCEMTMTLWNACGAPVRELQCPVTAAFSPWGGRCSQFEWYREGGGEEGKTGEEG